MPFAALWVGGSGGSGVAGKLLVDEVNVALDLLKARFGGYGGRT